MTDETLRQGAALYDALNHHAMTDHETPTRCAACGHPFALLVELEVTSDAPRRTDRREYAAKFRHVDGGVEHQYRWEGQA